MKCNFQSKVTIEEAVAAVRPARCYRCGRTARDLTSAGEMLEICGEEHGSDIEAGTMQTFAIALCPACHRENHRGVAGQHVPCQFKARDERETTI